MVWSTETDNCALWVASVRPPFDNWTVTGFSHAYPVALHLGIELHLDGAFTKVVAAQKEQHDEQAVETEHDVHHGVEMQLSVQLHEFQGQETRVVHHLHWIEVDCSQDVTEFVLGGGVTLHIWEFKIVVV